MMAGLGAKDILRNITALEQLIEEINFQRAKEMRQCLMSKDSDTSFVIVHGTTYWTDLFVRHFLFQTDRSTDADDLLFFIRKKQVRGSRYIPKYQTEVEVYRKDSRKLPIGDPDIDWEETVYLNLIIHQFDYTLTLAVCTRTSPKELQVLKRHSQKVYASPSRRRMDTKGEVEEITYPNVCFHVDNFDEVFADMLVRDGEMVCVELVAADQSGSRQAVIFLGSIRYDALKRVYDTRASLSSKVAQRMMMGLFSGAASQRIEFVRMKGPQGKGHAEMAVTKPKGSGVETPTSEPGVSLTDLWDSDWEDEPEDRFLYRHQRRLSDPSANFNTFINSGWVSKAEGKSRSENEGLDNFANGFYEIESGDVRDAMCSCRCCSVIACRKYVEEDLFNGGTCDKCEHFHGEQKPTPLGHSDFHANAEEEQEDEFHDAVENNEDNVGKDDFEVVVGVEASECLEPELLAKQEECDLKPDLKGGTEKTSAVDEVDRSDSPSEEDPFLVPAISNPKSEDSPSVTFKDGRPPFSPPPSTDSHFNRWFSFRRNSKRTPGSAIRVKSSPDLNARHSAPSDYIPLSTKEDPIISQQPSSPPPPPPQDSISRSLPEPHARIRYAHADQLHRKRPPKRTLSSGPTYFKSVSLDPKKVEDYFKSSSESSSILTKSKSLDDVDAFKKMLRSKISIPYRVTKDGTKVYFPFDLKLDDGAYNPLWTTKGFTQTFHFWKESRRAQSVPLNAYLTYVTLPWFTIITDILDHRTGPILTF